MVAFFCPPPFMKTVTGYRFYRINATATQTSSQVAIDEMEIFNTLDVDQIPTMTGPTTSGVTATASTTAAAGFEPWRAGNNAAANYWGGNGPPAWLQWEFTAPFVCNKYSIQAPSTNGAQVYAPKTWTFEGSNTGAFSGEQVTLDSQTGAANWSSGEKRTFTF